VAYYFLIAQLPQLKYGQEPPLSSAAFLERFGVMLSKPDAALLSLCRLGLLSGEESAPTSSALINAWRERERVLTLTLAKLRAAKLKFEDFAAAAEAPEGMDEIKALAKAAFTMEDPFEAELFLDKGRWDAIESFVGLEYFTADVVFAYFLKLLLIERRSSFKVEEGFAEYKALYAGIIESAPKAGANGESE
jgi:hypothetical protein